MINTEVKALVSGELSLTNWKTYMSCNCVEGGKELLRAICGKPNGKKSPMMRATGN